MLPVGNSRIKAGYYKTLVMACASDRILKVWRIITDLTSSKDIRPVYISVALKSSSLDRIIWQILTLFCNNY